MEHRPGVHHGNADGMSRRLCPKKTCVCKGGDDIGGGAQTFGGPADCLQSASLDPSAMMNGESNDDSVYNEDLLERSNRRTEVRTTSTTQEQVKHTRHPTGEVDQSTVADSTSSDICMSWTWDDLGSAHKEDKEMGRIVEWLTNKAEERYGTIWL